MDNIFPLDTIARPNPPPYLTYRYSVSPFLKLYIQLSNWKSTYLKLPIFSCKLKFSTSKLSLICFNPNTSENIIIIVYSFEC